MGLPESCGSMFIRHLESSSPTYFRPPLGFRGRSSVMFFFYVFFIELLASVGLKYALLICSHLLFRSALFCFDVV